MLNKIVRKIYERSTNIFKIVPEIFQIFLKFLKVCLARHTNKDKIKLKEKDLGRVCQTCSQPKVRGIKNILRASLASMPQRSKQGLISILKFGQAKCAFKFWASQPYWCRGLSLRIQAELKPSPIWFVGTTNKPTCFFFMWAGLDPTIHVGLRQRSNLYLATIGLTQQWLENASNVNYLLALLA